MGEYVLVTTTEVDEKMMPRKPGAINGGFFQKTDDKPSQYPSVVIQVDDIKESMKKVEEAGGKVLGEPMEFGIYTIFQKDGIYQVQNEAEIRNLLKHDSVLSSVN